jgi:hypothetical protein
MRPSSSRHGPRRRRLTYVPTLPPLRHQCCMFTGSARGRQGGWLACRACLDKPINHALSCHKVVGYASGVRLASPAGGDDHRGPNWVADTRVGAAPQPSRNCGSCSGTRANPTPKVGLARRCAKRAFAFAYGIAHPLRKRGPLSTRDAIRVYDGYDGCGIGPRHARDSGDRARAVVWGVGEHPRSDTLPPYDRRSYGPSAAHRCVARSAAPRMPRVAAKARNGYAGGHRAQAARYEWRHAHCRRPRVTVTCRCRGVPLATSALARGSGCCGIPGGSPAAARRAARARSPTPHEPRQLRCHCTARVRPRLVSRRKLQPMRPAGCGRGPRSAMRGLRRSEGGHGCFGCDGGRRSCDGCVAG